MKQIPMCVKCVEAITELNLAYNCRELVGCKANPSIKSYSDAYVLCPLIQPNEVKHDSDVCEG